MSTCAGFAGLGEKLEATLRKDDLLRTLLQQAMPLGAEYIVKMAVGEIRHGAPE